MIYLAAGQLVLIAGLVWFIGRRETEHAQTLVDVMSAQEAERAELLNRIQRPDFIPIRPSTPRAPSEPVERPEEVAAYRKVGVVSPLNDPEA